MSYQRHPGIIALAALLVALLDARSAHAQRTPWRWGAWVSGALATPAASMRDLPGAPTCIDSASRLAPDGGGALALGGEIGWRAGGDDPLELSARVGLALGSTAFAAQERIGESIDGGGRLHSTIVEYRSVVDLVELRIEPRALWHPTGMLVVAVGPSLSLPLSVRYDQRERLVAPSQATYADGTAERAIATGTIDDATSAWIGIGVSAGLEIEVARLLLVRPEIGGTLAVGSPLGDVDWHPHELRAGVAVLFGALEESTPIMPLPD